MGQEEQCRFLNFASKYQNVVNQIALSYHRLYLYFKTYPLCFGVDLGSG